MNCNYMCLKRVAATAESRSFPERAEILDDIDALSSTLFDDWVSTLASSEQDSHLALVDRIIDMVYGKMGIKFKIDNDNLDESFTHFRQHRIDECAGSHDIYHAQFESLIDYDFILVSSVMTHNTIQQVYGVVRLIIEMNLSFLPKSTQDRIQHDFCGITPLEGDSRETSTELDFLTHESSADLSDCDKLRILNKNESRADTLIPVSNTYRFNYFKSIASSEDPLIRSIYKSRIQSLLIRFDFSSSTIKDWETVPIYLEKDTEAMTHKERSDLQEKLLAFINRLVQEDAHRAIKLLTASGMLVDYLNTEAERIYKELSVAVADTKPKLARKPVLQNPIRRSASRYSCNNFSRYRAG